MTTDPRPIAARIRRPGFKDPKLVIGILLVVLSVVAMVFVVQATDSRQGYWAASADAAPGEPITAENFTVVQAHLSEADGHYWSADEPLPETFAVTSTIRQGEFLPRATVSEHDPEDRQQFAIRTAEDVPDAVQPGSRVDLWVSQPDDQRQGYTNAELTAESAEVVAVEDQRSGLGASSTLTVYVLLTPEQLPAIIDAQAASAKISIVPASPGNER